MQNKFALKHWAMVIAHIGIAVTVIGITLNKSYSQERQVKISPGRDSAHLLAINFTFKKLDTENGPNYQSINATFAVAKNATCG